MSPTATFGPRWAAGPVSTDAPPLFLPLHIMLMVLIATAALAAISLRLYEPEASHDSLAVACGLAVVGLIVYARCVLRLPWFSASVVYLTLFWMFHFGLVFSAVLVPDVLTSFDDRAVEWLRWPNVRVAMLLGLLGAAGFVFGLGLTAGRSVARPVVLRDRAHDSALYGVGWLVMLVGLGMAGIALLGNGGLGVFAVGYREFRNTVLSPTNLFSHIQFSQLGCLLALCGAGGRRWVAPAAVWLAFGLVLLLLGLRNEALIPMITFAVILIHRGVLLNRGLLVAGALAALIAIPPIASFRTVGFSNRDLVNWTELTPIATLTELGGSLRAVKAYVDWIEGGDEYLLGASYWAPLDRHLLAWVLPGRQRIPIEQDERVPARDMPAREGAVGSASAGEAYYNFGPIGPFMYFACVGAVFGWLERRAAMSRYYCALLGIVMLPFYWNIRGQWITIPVQVSIGLGLLGFAYLLGNAARARARDIV